MEFPANSQNIGKDQRVKPDRPAKDVKKVVTGEVTVKPPSLGKKIKGIFFRGDAKSAAKYVGASVLLPALKNMFFEAYRIGGERMIFGDARDPRMGYYDPSRPRYSYNRPVNEDPRMRSAMLPQQPPYRAPSGPMPAGRPRDTSDIVLHSREDCEQILESLGDIIETHDAASLADFYSMLGLPSTYVENSWGWVSMSGSAIQQVRDGYMLLLPRPQAL